VLASLALPLARAFTVVALLGAVAPFAGCYGSTQSARDIGVDRATLAGRGTLDKGDAHVYFELWPSSQPAAIFKTIGTDLPGGISGPYDESTAKSFHGLTPATQYSYRLCARDTGSPNGACAQTLTFKTVTPAGDLVRGDYLTFFGGIGHSGSVHAHSDPSGADAAGTMTLPADKNTSGSSATFSGTVTCLIVQGNRATVGAVGTKGGSPATALFQIVDADATWVGSADQVDWTETTGSSPPNCATGSFVNLRGVYSSSVLVYDAR
jgi:hypothetical protein